MITIIKNKNRKKKQKEKKKTQWGKKDWRKTTKPKNRFCFFLFTVSKKKRNKFQLDYIHAKHKN